MPNLANTMKRRLAATCLFYVALASSQSHGGNPVVLADGIGSGLIDQAGGISSNGTVGSSEFGQLIRYDGPVEITSLSFNGRTRLGPQGVTARIYDWKPGSSIPEDLLWSGVLYANLDSNRDTFSIDVPNITASDYFYVTFQPQDHWIIYSWSAYDPTDLGRSQVTYFDDRWHVRHFSAPLALKVEGNPLPVPEPGVLPMAIFSAIFAAMGQRRRLSASRR